MPGIALVGEAWGEQEERLRLPFVGPTGYLLNQLLDEAEIRRSDCLITNVFNLRPGPKNEIEFLCVPKALDSSGLPPLRAGKYLDARYLPELDRLRDELVAFSPNVVVALGGTATWALLHDPRISKIRGTTAQSIHGHKVLPTYHPAAILRQWEYRPVALLDLIKAKRESAYPDVRRPQRFIHIEPTIPDLWSFYHEHLVSARAIAFDIETSGDQITCIGFAPRTDLALVVPFWDPRRGGNYWATGGDEAEAWRFVRTVLALRVPKVTQNGLFDVNFLWSRYGIPVTDWAEDTMLLHHALYPESEKGLGFLGSVYTNESSWKTAYRNRDMNKQGDD